MLYLEDYLEIIENLPMEMRDRFTEMREMDLQVQNTMDSMNSRARTFFRKCQGSESREEWKNEQFNQIKNEYSKALEDADEKVQLANQIYEMVDRYLRKLDQELSKFKMELEADNAGITEVLERRSLELDKSHSAMSSHRSEKRRAAAFYNVERQHHGSLHNTISNSSNHLDKSLSSNSGGDWSRDVSRSNNSNQRSSHSNNHTTSYNSSTSSASSGSTPTTSSSYNSTLQGTISYNLGHVGANSNAAIAAAASKAIGATLGMSQGRRTASLKASYEAVSRSAEMSKDTLPTTPDPSLASSPASSIADIPPTSTPSTKSRNKKQKISHTSSQLQAELQSSAPATPAPTDGIIPPIGEELLDPTTITYNYGPNEPRYCTCNDISYGEMVGCDNSDCPIEWFHYPCVGLRDAPKGKWYCPQCTVAIKRRGRK